MKLVFEVELQTYGEDEDQERELLLQIRDALEKVVALAEISVGVFTTSEVCRMEESNATRS